jgi:hypothetical protein
MRQRNAAARFSKKALGNPPKRSAGFFCDKRLQIKLEKAIVDGKLPRCAECDAPMKWFTGRKTGIGFLGCVRWGETGCDYKIWREEWARMTGNEALAKKLERRRAKAARRRQDAHASTSGAV